MQQTLEPKCPYCGRQMMLIHLSGEYPPDIRCQYTCLRCQAAAPKGTSEQEAYRLAMEVPESGGPTKEERASCSNS